MTGMGQDTGKPEVVALVDRSGAVVGRAERATVRRDNLMHATTGILVRDGDGRIYVHRRSTDKDWAPMRAAFQEALLSSPGSRIAAGTDEILKNIIAERVLGLPKLR